MKLRKVAKWLAISALVGLALAGVAFQQASIVVDGETMSIQELINREIDVEW